MRAPRPLLAALLVLTVAACDATAPSVGARLGEAELNVGETAALGGLAVTFDDVEEDSRCPDTAMCVWSGWAVVRVTVTGAPLRAPSGRLRVADPEREPEAGVRVGSRLVFATALTGDAYSDVDPVLTVAVYEVD